MIIPGVSGGTMAVITGVFEVMLEAISNLNKHIRKSFLTLLPIILGGLFGVFLLIHPVEMFLERFPILSKYSFCGLSLIGCVIFIKKEIGYRLSNIQFICLFAGSASALTITIFTQYYKLNPDHLGFLQLILIGIILSVALILPAVSFSYMLLFFGIYEDVLNAVLHFQLTLLIPLGFGILCGGYIFSKLLFNLINKYEKNTYCFVLGFVILSVADILY